MEELIVNLNANQMARDASQNTPITLAAINGHTHALRLLVGKYGIDPETRGNHGRTILHQVCSKGNLDLLKVLISELGCSVQSVDDDGNTALHIAAMFGHEEIVRELVFKHGFDGNCVNHKQQTAIHLALEHNRDSTVRMLISEIKCDPMTSDVEKRGVVHYAARVGNHQILTFLLQLPQSMPASNKDVYGHTPLYYAILNQNNYLVAELVKHNCKPSTINEEYRQLEQTSKQRLSEGSMTKIFVIGNKCVGKSTLVEALRSEACQDSSFSHKVVPHTSGIVLAAHDSKHYGKVLLYDFAGDAEYYSSHAAVLERLLMSSCHIFIIVVNLSESDEEILTTLGYWLTFVSYNSKSQQAKSQVIVVGSHADVVISKMENPQTRLVHLFTEAASELKSQYVEMVGYCALNCLEGQSSGMDELCKHLEHCSIQSRRPEMAEYVSEGASILLGVLVRDFKDKFACQVSEIRTHIEINNIFIPLEVDEVYGYLQELNAHGVILILGNREGLNDEWVVLNISAFLSSVHKQLFSPKALNHICNRRALSNLGIIAESDLNNVLPQYDPQLLVQCLKHLQYCIEVDDSQILYSLLQLQSGSVRGSDTPQDKSAKLLFFPALLKQISSCTFESAQAFCKGWYMECSDYYSYLPPRFLHVLLLRLAFAFALPPPQSSRRKPVSAYSRRCKLFKNAIQWMTEDGVECVVEVTQQSRAVVVGVMNSEESKLEAACTLAIVVSKVLEARQEFCHSLQANVFLIDPEYLKSHPFSTVDEQSLFDLSEVRDAIQSHAKRMVISVGGGRSLSLEHLWTHTMWNIVFPLSTLEVLKSIEPVVGPWYRLGLELGLTNGTLETIEHDHQRDVETCKRRMVREWLKKPQATWRSLELALLKVGEEEAAADVAEEHSDVISIQGCLLSESSADTELTQDFLSQFSEVIGSRWPLLASLLSFSTAEIEDIKRGVTGFPSIKAAAMLSRWREKQSLTPTYGLLKCKLLSVLEDQLCPGHDDS